MNPLYLGEGQLYCTDPGKGVVLYRTVVLYLYVSKSTRQLENSTVSLNSRIKASNGVTMIFVLLEPQMYVELTHNTAVKSR